MQLSKVPVHLWHYIQALYQGIADCFVQVTRELPGTAMHPQVSPKELAQCPLLPTIHHRAMPFWWGRAGTGYLTICYLSLSDMETIVYVLDI